LVFSHCPNRIRMMNLMILKKMMMKYLKMIYQMVNELVF